MIKWQLTDFFFFFFKTEWYVEMVQTPIGKDLKTSKKNDELQNQLV